MPIPGSTREAGVLESLGAYDVKLSDSDIAEVQKLVDEAEVSGRRYHELGDKMLEG